MSAPGRASGPLVQFVVEKRWVVRIGEARPTPGMRWVVDGQTCIVRRVVVLAPDRWRVYVEPDAAWDRAIPQYCGNSAPPDFRKGS